MTLKSNNILTNSNKRLSVQVSLTGLSFLVSVFDTKDVLFFSEKKFKDHRTPEELLFELKDEFSENNELQDSFKEVSVIYATNIYSLVPGSLFDETKASDYLKFNSKILGNDFIAHDILQNQGIVVVYVPFVNINNYLFDRFGGFQYYHATTILLKLILNAEKHSRDDKVYVHVQDSTFDLIAIKDGNLQLCNSYSYKTPEDFIYYILFSLEQLKLNPDTVETVLCGSITKEDTLYEIIYRYIRNVAFTTLESFREEGFSNSDTPPNFLLKNSL